MDLDDDTVIAVRGLTKSYGDFQALRGIDFEVRRGEVLALLGPNGAGKTTTVEILEGFRQRDGGEVRVLGSDPSHRDRAQRAKVGIVLQECAVEPYLTVAEALTQRSYLYRHPRPVGGVVEMVGLEAKRNARIKTLSGGQQRRLDLGLALIGDPELIFLDEPTTGFDPTARRESWDLVKGLCAEGRTVVLTTHYMDEAQALADEVAVIAGGRVVATGTPDTIGGPRPGPDHRPLPDPAGALPRRPAAAVGPLPKVQVRVGGVRPARRHHPAPRSHRLGGDQGQSPGRPDGDPAVARGRLPRASPGSEVTPRERPPRRPPPGELRAEGLLAEPDGRPSSPSCSRWCSCWWWAPRPVAPSIPDSTLRYDQYLVVAMLVFGLVAACYTNLGIMLSIRRDSGVLKRMRGTPMSPASYVGGIIGSVLINVGLLAILVVSIGMVGYNLHFPFHPLAVVVTLLVGVLTFSALGLAVTVIVPNAEAAPAVINGIYFPIVFISGVFYPIANNSVLSRIAAYFPVRHMVNALVGAFEGGPQSGLQGLGPPGDAAWAAAALVFAVTRFRWEPRRSLNRVSGRPGRPAATAAASPVP